MLATLYFLFGAITGYFTVPVYRELRRTRVAAEEKGEDTTTDPDVILIPSYKGMSFVSTPANIIMTALLAAAFLCFYALLSPTLAFGVVLLGALPFAVFLGLVDYVIFRLPFPIVGGMTAWTLLSAVMLNAVGEEVNMGAMLAGAATFFFFFFVVFLLSSGKMGFGDVVLAIPLGLILGAASQDWVSAVSVSLRAMLFGSVALVALAGAVTLKAKRGQGADGEKKVVTYTPYGPCLILGVAVALLMM